MRTIRDAPRSFTSKSAAPSSKSRRERRPPKTRGENERARTQRFAAALLRRPIRTSRASKGGPPPAPSGGWSRAKSGRRGRGIRDETRRNRHRQTRILRSRSCRRRTTPKHSRSSARCARDVARMHRGASEQQGATPTIRSARRARTRATRGERTRAVRTSPRPRRRVVQTRPRARSRRIQPSTRARQHTHRTSTRARWHTQRMTELARLRAGRPSLWVRRCDTARHSRWWDRARRRERLLRLMAAGQPIRSLAGGFPAKRVSRAARNKRASRPSVRSTARSMGSQW